MTARRKWWLWAALASAPLSLAAGWVWNRSCEPEYLASARVLIPQTIIDRAPDIFPTPGIERSFLAPEVLAAAADLLHERGVSLPLVSPFDSEVDYLLERTAAASEREGDRAEIELRYRTTDVEQAVPVLTAMVDAGVHALQGLVPEVVDSVLDDRIRERAHLAKSLEQQQSRIAELEGRIAARNREPPESALSAEGFRGLESGLEEARARRIEAEDHLARACQQVRAGIAVDEIVARLPEGPTWSATRDLAVTLRLKDELRQLETALEAAAVVYGRNHPRRVGLRAQVEQIRQKLNVRTEPAPETSTIQGSSSKEPEVASQAGAPMTGVLLLQALEEQCRQATAAEQQLEEKLASATASREERQSLDPQLANARQELTFLQMEHERLRREIVAARREAESRSVSVSESPTLSPTPIVPSLSQHLLAAGACGMLISGGFLRGYFRSSLGKAQSIGNQSEINGRERYRSRDEENLARLRRLKPVA